MTRSPWILSLLVLVTTAWTNERPNILFISVDDLNDFPTFAQRYPDAVTPHMDRLAKGGTVFTRAYCQFPLCGPSRASLMAGLYPSTLGYDNHIKDERLQERAAELGTELLHEAFSRQGYKTLAVGKICHHHVPRNSVDQSGGRKRFNTGTGNLKRNWPQKGTSTDWAIAPDRDEELPDHDTATWAVERLQEEHEKPFLLMVGFLRPHVPWYAPRKWFDLYDRDALTLPPYSSDDLDDISEAAKEISILSQMPRTEWAIENDQWRDILHAYLACISFADHQVGRVLEALEASPYRDNTLIVLWSDHGYHIGEKNTFQKQSLWERSAHVPLVFSGPGIGSGERCNRVVSLLDLYPTLLEMSGLPANPKNEGRSLVPLINNPMLAWPHPAITGWKKNSFAIQNEQFHYLRYEDGSEELYDHETDLKEWKNLAGDPAYQETKEALSEQLDQFIKREQP